MSDREIRSRSPVERSESLRDDSRHRYGSRSSPPRRVRYEYSTAERRDRFSRRERHERENPEESRCLGVFGMSRNTKEEDLRKVFSPYGHIEKIKIIYDAKTNESRGYAFIYYENVEDAKEARKHCNNLQISEKTIRVDFSVTTHAHSPTPGMYMGRKSTANADRRDRRGRRGDDSSRYDSRYRRDSYRRYERGSRRNYSRSPRR